MKSLKEYIVEKIKDLPPSVKGIIVFDIDDTILKVDASDISIYKHEPGKPEVAFKVLFNHSSKKSTRLHH